MELEQMSSVELILLVRRQEQELAAARAALELSHARQLELESPVAQQGGVKLAQDEALQDLIECLRRDAAGGMACDVYKLDAAADYLESFAQRAASVPAQAEHDLEEQQYIGARLRRVAKAAGITVDYGDDEFYFAGAFSILGDIARALDNKVASVPAQATPEWKLLRREIENEMNTAPTLHGMRKWKAHLATLDASPVPADSVQPDERKYTQDDMERFAKECMAARDARVAAANQPDIGRDAALVQALQKIKQNETEVFDEDMGEMVIVGLDAEEMVEIASAALATQPAPEVASVQPVAVPEDEPPIPVGVCWSESRCDFYKADTGYLMGDDFYDEWWHRCDEFPDRDTALCALAAAPSAPAVQVQDDEKWIDRATYDAQVDEWSIQVENLEHEMATLRAAAPAQPAAPNPQDAVDAARLDWLNENFFLGEKDEWEERQHPNSIKWTFFGPKGVQGRVRDVIDAARANKEA